MNKLVVIALCTLLISCGDGMLREYLNSDSLIWTNAPILVDSTGYAEVTIRTDFGYPEIVVLYGCQEYDIHKLKKFDADLIIDGNVIEADEGNINAYYASGAGVDFEPGQSLDSLAEKLGVADSSQWMESFSVSIQLAKSYKSVKEFPRQLSVRLTSESANGNTDTTFTLTLRESKDTRAPIRIH